MMREAFVTIDGYNLTIGQVITLRVAVTQMLLDLADPTKVKELDGQTQLEALGEIGLLYQQNLRELEHLLINHQPKMETFKTGAILFLDQSDLRCECDDVYDENNKLHLTRLRYDAWNALIRAHYVVFRAPGKPDRVIKNRFSAPGKPDKVIKNHEAA